MKSFAYGSNLCRGWLSRRVPCAKYEFVARLPNYTLRFNKRSDDGSGKGNAWFTGQQTDEVLGVVVDVPDEQKYRLDRAEGLGRGYEEQEVEVFVLGGESVTVRAYIGSSSHIDDSLTPYSWYIGLVQRGARARGLPREYIEGLLEWESVEDENPTRAAKAQVDCA